MKDKKIGGAPLAGKGSPRKVIDWESVEIHYRAGIRSLKNIGSEFDVSDAAIVKRAKRDGWTRDLKAKIKAKADAKVSAAVVSGSVSARTKVAEAQVIEANASIIASADLVQREDVLLGLDTSRGMLQELALLSDPEFKERLVLLGEAMDESGPTANGGWKTDKTNELYQYIISLAGRIKMAKDVAATHGVYIPLQRKVLRMEDEAEKGASAIDAILNQVLASK